MDINTLRTVLLVICFSVFVGICIWAYGGRRDRFAEAARLPLMDETERDGGDHPQR